MTEKTRLTTAIGVLISINAAACASTDANEFAVQGPHGVVREDTPDFVYFYPEGLDQEATWPSLVWFNGINGYTEDFNYNEHLESIASWGFVVIGGKESGMNPIESDQRAELLRRNDDPDDVLSGRIDQQRIAVSGHSLGGVQAILASPDYRAAVAVQGALSLPPEGTPPTLFMTSYGDVTFPASTIVPVYEAAQSPAWLAIHASVDHSDPRTDGGAYREPTIAFLRWRLHDDANGAAWFEGDSCVLCGSASWSFESH